MKIDRYGNYIPENIDALISEFESFRSFLHSILRSDDEIREAILNGSYKDNLVLKYIVEETYKDLHNIVRNHKLYATHDEMIEAAGSHPYLVD